MGKNNPRHNPDKPQNKWGGDYECPYYDAGSWGQGVIAHCDYGYNVDLCHGNRHSCIKNLYKQSAIKKDKRDDRTYKDDM